MNEHPKAVEFRIADDQKITDNKIDTLSVARDGEMVGNMLEDVREGCTLDDWHGEGAVEIFFDLREAGVRQ